MPVEDPAVREATRAAIVGSPYGETIAPADSPASRLTNARRPAMRTRRRLVLMLTAAFLLVVVPATGAWAYFTYFSGPETVLDEFHSAQKAFTLPAGAKWREPDLPDNAVFGSRLGLIMAWAQATDAWFAEWLAADKIHDSARADAASAALDQLVAVIPVHREGDPEEAGGFDEASVQYFMDLIERGKQGDLSAVREYLEAKAQ
jgi:hypothetical protein